MTTPTQPTWRSHYTLLVLLFVYTNRLSGL